MKTKEMLKELECCIRQARGEQNEAAALDGISARWDEYAKRTRTTSWAAMVAGQIASAILCGSFMNTGFNASTIAVGAIVALGFFVFRSEMAEYTYMSFVSLMWSILVMGEAVRLTLSNIRGGLWGCGLWPAYVMAIVSLMACMAIWGKVFARQREFDQLCLEVRKLEKMLVQVTGQ